MRRGTAYGEYLVSEHWQDVRAEALERARGVCQRCRLATASEVHHTSYARLGREHPDDLQALCRPCHAAVHGVPVGAGL